jgi:hypothetical protein
VEQYLEIAQRTPRNRGFLIAKPALAQYINAHTSLYRSIYIYEESACNLVKKEGSIKRYKGLRDIDNVIVDVDKGGNSDEYTLKLLQSCIYELNELGLDNNAMQPYFSGSGYHLHITNEAFNFAKSVELPQVVKATMSKLLPDIDVSIYSRTGIYRVAHTINVKTGLYKIPISHKEVYTLKPSEIFALASDQRLDYPYKMLMADGELEEHIQANPSNVISFGNVTEPNKIVPCVQSLLRQGPIEGTRHTVALRIISHWRRSGIPSEYAKSMILHWNNKSADEQEMVDLVESAYNGNYQYGCNDDIMGANCKTRCIHFKRKDYAVEIMNVEDMQSQYNDRMTTNYNGKMVDLGSMLGLEGVDCTLLPGELITIFGGTGSNKTTLAQNIALGVDLNNDRIVKEWQIPTLFLSLELSAWYMHRRHLQIVSGLSKDEVNADYRNVFNEHKDYLSHIVVQTVSPTIDQIQHKIKELQPALVIVDYIDLVDTPPAYRGEYEKIKYISHSLSNIAVNLDVVIIQVSQISRDYSRNDVLDLYAGKGSGAIENASRKVIGLQGQSAVTTKTLQMFKNTDGELFKANLQWRPSFRMKRIPMEDV